MFSSVVNSSAKPLYQLTVGESEIVGQFHGDPINADLRLYMAGNQFIVMDLLVKAFKEENPKIRNIFYVTIPPGKELKWILNSGLEIHGKNSLEKTGFQLKILPDVYASVNKGHMDKLNAAKIIDRFYTYAHNRIVLMVRANDPLAGSKITAQKFYDLMADPTVKISEPDIISQGIERHIWQMYTDTSKFLLPKNTKIKALNGKMFDPEKLGADPEKSLRRIVYHDKIKAGKTLLTSVHHIETPANIRAGKTRLGPVWATEVLYQKID